MKKKKLQCSVPTLLLAGVLCLTLAACGAKQSSDMLASDTDSAARSSTIAILMQGSLLVLEFQDNYITACRG